MIDATLVSAFVGLFGVLHGFAAAAALLRGL